MVLQQFGGVNGIAFYASAIFITAGRKRIVFFLSLIFYPLFNATYSSQEMEVE